ncbi:DsbA family protein [Salibacterium aidingense]|uniref:DsbA family protein n=1 Tax=Salibacterium aidingense TaxID=384933 RepID=UPI003BE7A18F
MKSKILVIVTGIVFLGMGAFLLWGPGESPSDHQETAVEGDLENQPVMGEEEAPVEVVEFGDYKCPACKSWSETVFPILKENYINSGEVSFTYINTLFHGEESELAALASEAVWDRYPESFWSFHEIVFQNQPSQQSHDQEWITPETLGEMAEQMDEGPEAGELIEDIEQKTYREQVKVDETLVDENNIQFTPSILINGTLIEDPFDWEAIQTAIENGLEENA